MTGAKTKCDFKRQIVIVGHFVARKQNIWNLKKGCAIMWTIKDNTDAQLLYQIQWNYDPDVNKSTCFC